MRVIGTLAVLAMLTGACTAGSTTPTELPSTTTTTVVTTRASSDPAATTSAPQEPTPTTIDPPPPSTTTTTPGPGTDIGGTLPDGTPYTVIFDRAVDRAVRSISGAIMIDLEDGTSRALGISVFRAGVDAEPSLDQLLRYTVPAGQGAVYISIDEKAAEQIPDLEDFLGQTIVAGTTSRLPTLQLSPPLRWATDDEIPLQMEVEYEGFVVRRGCGPLATACSPTGAAQVISADKVFSGDPGLPAEPVWIESPAPRPADQPGYVAPGPLTIRTDHDVLWTGSEVVVWGGADGDTLPTLIDGAAFDPVTSEWRLLPAPPFDNQTVSRAIWVEGQMIVISAEATLAYDPDTDEWSVVGDGLFPPTTPGFLVWTGETVVAWTSSGLHSFDPAEGVWGQLPDPGFGSSDRWEASLHVLDGRVYAVGLADQYCGGRLVAAWSGSEWQPAPPVALHADEYADCSFANQTGVANGRLIIWDDDAHPVGSLDPDTNRWTTLESIPLGGAEGPSGAVLIDGGFLVPRWGEAAIFDGASQLWTKVRLPGQGEGQHMIWTGTELFMWGSACCFGDGTPGFRSMDAWRWTPPAK